MATPPRHRNVAGQLRVVKDAALLVIGHPGHELRCHGWMCTRRPTVFVLTDGGGHANRPRLDYTRDTVVRSGAHPGRCFGAFTDREIYRCMLDGETDKLIECARTISDTILSLRPAIVVCDMIEGYNPSHDLCRYLTRAAIEAAAERGWSVREDLCMPLIGHPERAWNGRLQWSQQLTLDDTQLAAKLDAARRNPELAAEVASAIRELGEDAFRHECFYPSPPGSLLDDGLPDPRPYYETYGEQQRRAGHYDDVIRFDMNVRPLMRKVRAALGLDGARAAG